MIRLMILELKRSLKSRMTQILLAAALVLSVLMGMLVISYTEYHYLDNNGTEAKITGLKAIEANRKMMEPYKGRLTSEKISKAIKTNRVLERKYGEDIPLKIYYQEKYPTLEILNTVQGMYHGSDGLPLSLSEIKDKDAKAYYEKRTDSINNTIAAKYPGDTDAQKSVKKLNDQVNTPFYFVYGYAQSNAADYVLFCLILLGLLCAVLAAPVFSLEYQTGADDILRCTKNGRAKLACSKILSAMLIAALCFAVCISIYLVIVNTAYGWDSLKASAQLIWSAMAFVPLSSGGLQAITVAAGFAGVLAIVSFTLFLSSKCRTSMVAVILALIFCLLPTIVSAVLSGNIAEWISCLLPAGGAGMNHSFYYEMMGNTFLQAGPVSIWSPYVIAAAAIIEIPLFLILAVRSYCRHEA